MHETPHQGFNFASPPPIAETYTLESCSVSITAVAREQYGLMALRLSDGDQPSSPQNAADDKRFQIIIAGASELDYNIQDVPEDSIATYVDGHYTAGVARLAVATSLSRGQTIQQVEDTFKAENDLDEEDFRRAIAEYEERTGEVFKGHVNIHAQHALVHNFIDKIDEYMDVALPAYELTDQENKRAHRRAVRARTLLAVPPAVLGYQLLINDFQPAVLAFMTTVALAVHAYDLQLEKKNIPNYVETIETSRKLGGQVLKDFHELFIGE